MMINGPQQPTANQDAPAVTRHGDPETISGAHQSWGAESTVWVEAMVNEHHNEHRWTIDHYYCWFINKHYCNTYRIDVH